MDIREIARQAARESVGDWRGDCPFAKRDQMADAVAVKVLREVEKRGSSYADDTARDLLAAFTPAEPPQQGDEVDTAGYCKQCGAITLAGADYCEDHIPPPSAAACDRYRELAGPFQRGRCDKCDLPESDHHPVAPAEPATCKPDLHVAPAEPATCKPDLHVAPAEPQTPEPDAAPSEAKMAYLCAGCGPIDVVAPDETCPYCGAAPEDIARRVLPAAPVSSGARPALPSTKKDEIEVIVNGCPVVVPAGPIRVVIAAAVQRSGQIGAPIDQWVLRTTDGDIIPHNLGAEWELTGGQRLWMHLGLPSDARPARQTVEQAKAKVLDMMRSRGYGSMAYVPAIDALLLAVRQEQADARPARTLKDYRPQHDEGCDSRHCTQCAGTRQFHRDVLGVLDNPHAFAPKPCTCGLDALLSGGAPQSSNDLRAEAQREAFDDVLADAERDLATYVAATGNVHPTRSDSDLFAFIRELKRRIKPQERR